MTRYRKLETGMWIDRRFRELSAPPPNGRDLWIYLLAGQRTTVFPGLVVATEVVIASDLGWPVSAPDLFAAAGGDGPRCFRDAWKEIESKGMAVCDWAAGVVVLPRALLDRRGAPRESAHPRSPNQFQGWSKSWSEIPECDLKEWYLGELGRFAKALDTLAQHGLDPGGPKKTRRAPSSARIRGNARAKAAANADTADLAVPRNLYYDAYMHGFGTGTEPVPQPVPNQYPDPSPTGGGTGRGLTRARACGPDPDLLSEQGIQSVSDSGSGSTARALEASGSGSGSTAADRIERVQAPVSHLYHPADEPPLPGPVDPGSAETVARRKLGDRLWDLLNQKRQALAGELGLPPPRELHEMLPARSWLAQRIRESGERAEADVTHVLAVREAEVRRDPEAFRWFSGSMFSPNSWQSALADDPAAVATRRQRNGGGVPDVFAVVDEATAAIERAIAEGKPW